MLARLSHKVNRRRVGFWFFIGELRCFFGCEKRSESGFGLKGDYTRGLQVMTPLGNFSSDKFIHGSR
jgi:hypothetical protein